MVWTNRGVRTCGWRRFACALMTSLGCLVCVPVAAGEWLIEDAVGAPGDIVDVPVFFRADGRTAVAISTIYFSIPLHVDVQGVLPSDGEGLCVVDGYNLVRVTIGSARRDEGTLIRVCSIPVTVGQHFRASVSMSMGAGECLDVGAQPVECTGRGASFLVDGVPRWFERAPVVVPHAAPFGPTQEALLQFDYAGNPDTPPLRSFDAPRPVHVDTIFARGDWAFRKSSAAPNAAVTALLRAVRPTYASTTDHAAGVAAARNDPLVEAVIPHAGQFPHLIYPSRPVAGQPFALWFATYACRIFIPDSYDDRIVRTEGNAVHVYVPELSLACGVPPPGEFHNLLNMPGLPAGEYTLYITGYEDDPDVPPDLSWPLPFVVAPGGVEADPVRIPVAGFAWLVALALTLVAFALRMRVR